MRVVHDYPSLAVIYGHGVGHIAKLHAVGSVEHLVFHGIGCWIVVGEGGVAVLEVPFVRNEKAVAACGEIFVDRAVVPFHAALKQSCNGQDGR